MNSVQLVFVGAFVTLAASCLLPSVPFYASHNETLLQSLLDVESSTPMLGWLHSIGTGAPVHTWPQGVDGFVTVPYCFRDEDDMTFIVNGMQLKTANVIELAWREWSRRLGQAGEANGHRLAGFKLYPENGRGLVCQNDDGTWRKEVPTDAVMVRAYREDKFGGGEATVGYLPIENFPSMPNEARHGMTLGLRGGGAGTGYELWKYMISVIAHEMGHILGFLHEHQRHDRDHYVRFDCSALEDYDKVKQKVESDGKSTIEQACTDARVAQSYRFSAAHWMKLPASAMINNQMVIQVYTRSETYDVTSIMHYPTWGGKPGRPVLVKWKKTYSANDPPPETPNKDTAGVIDKNYVPSVLDVQAMKELYAW